MDGQKNIFHISDGGKLFSTKYQRQTAEPLKRSYKNSQLESSWTAGSRIIEVKQLY